MDRVEIDRYDNLYLLIGEERIEVYGPSGRLLRTLGPEGQGFEWKGPIDIALDSHERLYVLDRKARHGETKTCSVSVFDRQGALLAWILSPEIGAAQFKDPLALTVDRSGGVYILDGKTRTVLRFQ